MDLLQDNAAARERLAGARHAGLSIGLVPTMGALHAGHIALVERARRACDRVVVSLFVNPTQFGPGEDFERYPRDLTHDARACEQAGVDWLYAPPASELYRPGPPTLVVPPDDLTSGLCGAFRPGHFTGVATVVTKLFALWAPDRAYFGQKDFQQTLVVRRVAEDLCLPVEVVVVPTVREPDGLALSSRNRYLSSAERRAARAIPLALDAAWRAGQAPDATAAAVLGAANGALAREPGLAVQYVALVSGASGQALQALAPDAVLAIAAHAGATRLIDNFELASPCGPLVLPTRSQESTP